MEHLDDKPTCLSTRDGLARGLGIAITGSPIIGWLEAGIGSKTEVLSEEETDTIARGLTGLDDVNPGCWGVGCGCTSTAVLLGEAQVAREEEELAEGGGGAIMAD
ncbi:unnamed protein product [Protopolystoma xenopodis]|uniref:Uncharacterized protein n=1 Tax=Protopolystoma xenopodis TaxID=117903 RepID=A0A3S5BDV7_9PLAT|nr:unnamed protein product [Protopolystoma xenopodis]